MRQITDHHDGHGLNESIGITADDLGPGGASHEYTFTINGEEVRATPVSESLTLTRRRAVTA
jgi:VCBS repeat-containing protein